MSAFGSTWMGRWIEPTQEPVTVEPEFSLAQMFGGASLPKQAPVEERLHPTQLLRRTFETHETVTHATLLIFAVVFLVKWGFTFTPWGDVFAFVKQVVSAPIMNVGTSPAAAILVYTLANLVWFFGIHPSSITSVFIPVIIAASMENVAAFQAGQPLPNLTFVLLLSCLSFGGTGNTLSLCLDMYTAKSEKFKAMRNLMTIPNFFNINEPVVFGVPVMLNPIFFVPMVLSSIVPGLVGLALINVLPITTNPAVQLPWATPTIISATMQSGPLMGLVVIACIAVTSLLYLPFFKVADQQAYEEEQAIATGKAAE